MMAAGKVSKLADGVPSMKLNLEPRGQEQAGVGGSEPRLCAISSLVLPRPPPAPRKVVPKMCPGQKDPPAPSTSQAGLLVQQRYQQQAESKAAGFLDALSPGSL